jgi:transcriptional regulator with PAS, ATPase and Fis domain
MSKTKDVDLNEILHNTEIDLIFTALRNSGKNVAAAARSLNINRTTLIEKCRKYKIMCSKCNYVFCVCEED